MQVKLVMFRESGDRREFPLKEGKTSIGRKDDCDIRIPLSDVSRHHTEIVVDGKSAVLKDLGSANGTYVNNKPVKTHKLAAGDHVVVGPVVFTVQVDGQPEDIRPVKTKLRPLSAVGNTAKSSDSAVAEQVFSRDDEVDPISALEALASSADQTAIDPFEDDGGIL